MIKKLFKNKLVLTIIVSLIPTVIISLVVFIVFMGTSNFLTGLIDSFTPFKTEAKKCTTESTSEVDRCINDAEENYNKKEEKEENSNKPDTGVGKSFDNTSLKINLKSAHYTSSSPFTQHGFWGQCTWFVWGRAREKWGKVYPANLGHGGQWYASAQARGIRSGKKIKANSIVSMSGGAYGHVAFIEKIEGNTVYITESNIAGLGVLSSSKISLKSLKNGSYLGMRINGYIYVK